MRPIVLVRNISKGIQHIDRRASGGGIIRFDSEMALAVLELVESAIAVVERNDDDGYGDAGNFCPHMARLTSLTSGIDKGDLRGTIAQCKKSQNI